MVGETRPLEFWFLKRMLMLYTEKTSAEVAANTRLATSLARTTRNRQLLGISPEEI